MSSFPIFTHSKEEKDQKSRKVLKRIKRLLNPWPLCTMRSSLFSRSLLDPLCLNHGVGLGKRTLRSLSTLPPLTIIRLVGTCSQDFWSCRSSGLYEKWDRHRAEVWERELAGCTGSKWERLSLSAHIWTAAFTPDFPPQASWAEKSQPLWISPSNG